MKICDLPVYKRLSETAYAVKKKDLVVAAKLMAVAFTDDPSIRYLLGGEKEGVNDWRYFLCVLKSVYGKCVMLSSDEKLENLVVLFPPELKAVPSVSFLFRGGWGLWRYFGVGLYLRSISYEGNCQKVKSRCITPKTWYCMCFVVSPEMQGRGVGSRLFRPILEALNDVDAPLYLETHKAINVDIYKHYGFKSTEISKIPKTNIKQYGMIKEIARNFDYAPLFLTNEI